MTRSLLLDVDRRSLLDVAAALRNGTLRMPVNEQELRHHAGGAAGLLSMEMGRLADLGMNARSIGELLAIVGDAKREAERAHDEVALVWSGPEEGASQTRDTSVVVDDLFRHAKIDVLIATFAIHDGKSVFASLAERMTAVPGLRVRLFAHVARTKVEKRPDAEVLHAFARRFRDEQWPTGVRLPEVFYDPRTLAIGGATRASLHAKCIVVDDERALVTSANFTEAAQQRNIEAGVLIDNPRFARGLREQFDVLVARGLMTQMPNP